MHIFLTPRHIRKYNYILPTGNYFAWLKYGTKPKTENITRLFSIYYIKQHQDIPIVELAAGHVAATVVSLSAGSIRQVPDAVAPLLVVIVVGTCPSWQNATMLPSLFPTETNWGLPAAPTANGFNTTLVPAVFPLKLVAVLVEIQITRVLLPEVNDLAEV